MKRHSAPILAAILLLLPVVYVGSYFALVVPRGYVTEANGFFTVHDYRSRPSECALLFAPLEYVDRRLRPESWRQFRDLYKPPIQE
jgi:hypothetical protein